MVIIVLDLFGRIQVPGQLRDRRVELEHRDVSVLPAVRPVRTAAADGGSCTHTDTHTRTHCVASNKQARDVWSDGTVIVAGPYLCILRRVLLLVLLTLTLGTSGVSLRAVRLPPDQQSRRHVRRRYRQLAAPHRRHVQSLGV